MQSMSVKKSIIVLFVLVIALVSGFIIFSLLSEPAKAPSGEGIISRKTETPSVNGPKEDPAGN